MSENSSTLVRNRSEHPRAEDTRNGQFYTPRVDIIETDKELLIYADMPGALPHDIDLRYEQGELTVRGKVQPSEARGNLVFGEYEVRDFHRVFLVHDTIDAAQIDADYNN